MQRMRTASAYLASLVGVLLALALPLAAAAPRLNDIGAVPHLDARGKEAYRAFLAAELHRAFVVAPGGAWAWRSGLVSAELALRQALADCQRHAEAGCQAYAVDDRVVFDAAAWARAWGPYADAAAAARAAEGTRRGERFPDLALTDPRGRPWRLSSQRGKVVVLHFWGSWCPVCRHELPQFVALQNALRQERDIVFVHLQVREPVETARQWLRAQRLNLSVYDSGARGPRDDTLRLADGRTLPDRAVAPVFPSTVVLDRHGIVVFTQRGPAADWSQFVPQLRDVAARSGR